MKITRIVAVPFTLPLWPNEVTVSAASRDLVRTFDGVLVEVHCDEGFVGIAEAPARPHIYGETQASIVEAICHHLGPPLIGVDPLDVEKVVASLEPPIALVGNPTAKGALDLAIHDIIGQRLGLPAYKLLGGWLEPPVIDLSWILMLGPVEKVVAAALLKQAEGFRSFKVKVGRDPNHDVVLIRELRRALGNGVLIYIDANQAYQPDVAIRTVTQMEEFGLAWVEDPCSVELPAQVRRRVANALHVPILGDNACFTPASVLRELQEGTTTMVQIKVARTGYSGARRILWLADQFGIPCQIGSQGDSAIGTLAAGHFAAAFRAIRQPTELSYMLQMEDQIIDVMPVVRGGKMHLPASAGNGATTNRVKLSKHAVSVRKVHRAEVK